MEITRRQFVGAALAASILPAQRPRGSFAGVPFDEELRDRLTVRSPTEIHLRSPTTRQSCYGEDPTKALVCDLEGGPDSRLIVRLRQPVEKTITMRLDELVRDNRITFTGPFTAESFVVGPLLAPAETSATIRWQDRRPNVEGPDWYYVRARQHNGHMAWSSPIWVG